MSRLRELRLHGFKSFADPTRFVFEPGVNAVIGPNGSGKSNMADAVRWVLGEQSNRYLRTRRAEDVIFAGSQARRPQGMAEAILTLDNADGGLPIEFGEVSIGRRAYRSGESEYLINGARARLRDIVDLLGEGQLGANALVVVGQGTVDSALSLRPEERRQLFEDAAGVKSLQVRNNEALSRLVRSRDNLSRVADVVGELKPQVRRLALQAQHQQERAATGQRARRLVVEQHRRRERQLRTALGEARRASAGAESALDAHRSEQAAGRRVVEAAEAAYWDAEAAARKAGLRRAETREAMVRTEGRAESLEARAVELRSAIDAADASLRTAHASLAALGDADGLEAEIAPALAEVAAAEARWQAAISSLAAADAGLVDAEERLAGARAADADGIAAAARAAERHLAAAERVTRLESEVAEAERQAAQAADALGPLRAASGSSTAARDGARDRLRVATEHVERATGEAHDAEAAARAFETRVSGLAGELAALDERMARGDQLGGRLAAAGWPRFVDAAEPPREAWAALEAVLGGGLDDVFIWDGEDPASIAAESGGSARLAAAAVAPDDDRRVAALAAVGGTRTLAEWVGGTVPLPLQRVAVAGSLGALLGGWRSLPPGWAAVTDAGDLADGRGIVSVRGRRDRHAGEAARLHARHRELTRDLAPAHRDREQGRAAAGAAAAELAERESARQAARRTADVTEQEHRAAAEATATAEVAVARVTAELARLQGDLDDARTGLAAHASPPPSAASAVIETLASEARTRRQVRDAASAERDEARAAWQAARGAAENAEARSAGRRGERAILAARIAGIESTRPGQVAALEGVEAERGIAVDAAREAAGADAAAAAAQRSAEEAREARRRSLLELEQGTGAAAAQVDELERAAQATAIDASRAEDALAAAGRERELALEGLAIEGAAVAAADPDEELAALSADDLDVELRRVRRTLGQIGSVNPFAVEEHRELAARLDGMTSQERDLNAAIAATDELIATLDTQINERFNTAFTQIAARFDEFCQLLFAGGSASLQLSDGEDGEAPGGIEIVVRPPGKRRQRLAMLSGGERALAGVALLFAMLSVNPVPFCILDEVDAALDEANIGRFADALRKLSEAIDFVVITHNRATIEVADTIYGVTMTDAAVSRVLSLRLADLPSAVTA